MILVYLIAKEPFPFPNCLHHSLLPKENLDAKMPSSLLLLLLPLPPQPPPPNSATIASAQSEPSSPMAHPHATSSTLTVHCIPSPLSHSDVGNGPTSMTAQIKVTRPWSRHGACQNLNIAQAWTPGPPWSNSEQSLPCQSSTEPACEIKGGEDPGTWHGVCQHGAAGSVLVSSKHGGWFWIWLLWTLNCLGGGG